MVINLKRARKFFGWNPMGKNFNWTICIPYNFKISRKALSFLRKNKIKLVKDIYVKEVYSNGDPIKPKFESNNCYNITPGYKDSNSESGYHQQSIMAPSGYDTPDLDFVYNQPSLRGPRGYDD